MLHTEFQTMVEIYQVINELFVSLVLRDYGRVEYDAV
jgi:hypothetical protein